MSVAGRDGTDGVDKLANDAFIFSIFCVKKFPKLLADRHQNAMDGLQVRLFYSFHLRKSKV